jgi:hypothetical protein
VVEVERLEGVVGVEKIESLDGMLIETEIESWKGESCWSLATLVPKFLRLRRFRFRSLNGREPVFSPVNLIGPLTFASETLLR